MCKYGKVKPQRKDGLLLKSFIAEEFKGVTDVASIIVS